MKNWTLVLVKNELDLNVIDDLLNSGKNVLVGICEYGISGYRKRTDVLMKMFSKENLEDRLRIAWMPPISEVVNACG